MIDSALSQNGRSDRLGRILRPVYQKLGEAIPDSRISIVLEFLFHVSGQDRKECQGHRSHPDQDRWNWNRVGEGYNS